MRASLRAICAVASLLLFVAACSSDEDTSTSETGEGGTTQPIEDESTSTSADDESSDGTGDSDSSRGRIGASFVGSAAQPTNGTVVEEEVKVYFNNGTSGNIVAVYHGPGLADPTGLCPGNSLNGANGFEFVSNAPASEGACEGFPTPRGEVRVCSSNVWLYQTMIPNDSEGQLFGSLEATVDGTIFNHTAVADNKPDTPEIDFSADVFDVDPMFTTDGSTEITCAAALA